MKRDGELWLYLTFMLPSVTEGEGEAGSSETPPRMKLLNLWAMLTFSESSQLSNVKYIVYMYMNNVQLFTKKYWNFLSMVYLLLVFLRLEMGENYEDCTFHIIDVIDLNYGCGSHKINQRFSTSCKGRIQIVLYSFRPNLQFV